MPTKVSRNALLARMKAKALSDAKAKEDAAAKAAVKLAREQAKKDEKQSQAIKRGRPAKINQPPAAKQESGSEVDDELWQRTQTTENTKKKKSKK